MNGTLDVVLDVLAAVCLLGGSLLTLAAGVGLIRFPDLLARMHTATKPQVLGLILMMLGLALRLRSGPVLWMLLLVALFQMLTSPVAAHMVARAGYRTGKVRKELLVVDELTRDLELAHAEVAQAEGASTPEDEKGRTARDENGGEEERGSVS
ncbi:monovalent cation/H(+) antiporter subunit G [Actinotalea sp. C106]|uniref:monovalent cation/H(+) antiporter subunit G n=1 Tax=Actinotalea sp. C106 TaxID=2908644 RepID=UPI0020293213|nr:monovalent cation/H(+) antiporter subunit G [Actinotalea sp. C106]